MVRKPLHKQTCGFRCRDGESTGEDWKTAWRCLSEYTQKSDSSSSREGYELAKLSAMDGIKGSSLEFKSRMRDSSFYMYVCIATLTRTALRLAHKRKSHTLFHRLQTS